MFFSVFLSEMIIKIIGMGPKRYVQDRYNIFDAIIVTLSVVDVGIS
jgi:Ion transport protein